MDNAAQAFKKRQPFFLKNINFPSKKVKLLVLSALIIFILSSVIYLLVAGLHIIEPVSAPQSVLISNVTASSATISWTTPKSTRGKVVLSKDGKFNPFIFITSGGFKDDGEKNLKKTGFYPTHHVTVESLAENSVYYFRIYQGWRKVYEGKLKSASILDSLAVPSPVYGRVLGSNGLPAAGVLVYLRATEASRSSSLISTMTNTEGRWSLDLANLRSSDSKKQFAVKKGTKEVLVVDSGEQRLKAETVFGKDKPWPDIILKKAGN